MLRYTMILALGACVFGLPVLTGCDREVSHEKEIKVKDDGTVKKHETTVTEGADGTVKKTETDRTNRP